MVPFRFTQINKHQQRIFTFTFALGFVYECYILFGKNLFLSDAAFAIALASVNDALRPTHMNAEAKAKIFSDVCRLFFDRFCLFFDFFAFTLISAWSE